MGKAKLLNSLLVLLSFSFLAFYFLLAFYTRFSEEDYDLLISFGKIGWFGTLKYYYLNWSCRWASLSYYYLWFGHVRSYAVLRLLVLIYSCFSMMALILLIYKIVSEGFKRVPFAMPGEFGMLSPSALSRFFISLLFCAALFFFMFQTSEVFFWVIASFDQVQPLLFFCLFLLMVIKHKTSGFDYFLILLSGLYIGGSSEIFAILLLALFAFFCLFLFIKKRVGTFMTSIQGQKITLGFVTMTVSLAFSLSAPGTYNRKVYESQHGSILMNKVDANQTEVNQNLQDKSPVHDHLIWTDILTQRKNAMTLSLIFALLFSLNLLAGGKLQNFYRSKTGESGNYVKNILLISALIFLISFAVFTVGFYFAFGNGTGPERAWAPFNFIALPCICFWGLALILKLNPSQRRMTFFALVFVLLSILLLNTYLFRQFNVVQKYAQAYDNSIRLFERNRQEQLPASQDYPMPDPGMLVPNILREDQFRKLGLKTD